MSSWEDRMAGRAAERAAPRKAEAARQQAEAEAAEVAERERRRTEGLPEPVDYPGHETHHWHVRYGICCQTCSCGELAGGFWSFVPDDRCWSDDPAEVARMRREDDDFRAWVTCCYCGETGVTAYDVFGTWPPRKLEG